MQNKPRRTYGHIPKKSVSKKTPHFEKKIIKKSREKKRSASKLVVLFGIVFTFLFSLIRQILHIVVKITKLLIPKKHSFGSLIKIGITVGILGVIGLSSIVVFVSKDLPDPDKLTDRIVAQSTKIYDKTGEHLLYEIFSEQKRTLVALEDIPEELKNGVIATEDAAFYEHKGIRPLSILRSLVYGVLGKSRLGGGASTLTQQLVKNAILTNERTITRKIKEIVLSVRLEQKYEKNQILQIYFNEIPYGSTNYGIQSASENYFGKPVQELTLAESATLAGIPKAPTRYLNNTEALKTRRNFVLRRMYEEGFITKEEKESAQSQPLELKKQFDSMKAPHFVLFVKEQLVEKYGEQLVDTGGLSVITSLDWEKQQIAEKAVKEQSEKTFEKARANNTALVAIDPSTGHILSMVGSRDFYDETIHGQFNVATLGKRQPGSSFKPIIYTAAFEKGYTPETVLFDVKTNFAASGRPYTPLNYDLQEHGPVTMRQALQGSLNIPAVKTLHLVGAKDGVDFAERLGYSTLSKGNFGLSLVLGGGEVHLLDHVGAYSVFANGGRKHNPTAILQVRDSNGNTLDEWKQTAGKRVLNNEVAATISHVLSDDGARAYAFGTGGTLTLPGRPVAAKTGTTNKYIDGWTIGYTPSLVAGVWAGNTDNTPMARGYGGSKVAGPIWKQFMTEALKEAPVENFPEPPENTTNKPALQGSQGGGITLQINKVTGNLANSSTPSNLITERTYTQQHSILHYVKKDDPQGSAPKEPTEDPQYQIWEDAIISWVERKKAEDPEWDISFEEPPAKEDDLYSLELIPSLEVIFPTPSTTITSPTITTDIRASAPRGVRRAKYRLDGKYIGLIKEHPFNLDKNITWLTEGDHILTISIEDDIGNVVEKDIPFTFLRNTANLENESIPETEEQEKPEESIETESP
ncbi:MAG: PBP1A family penicillin-binding protein [Candidatus Magasanikbacteria bacterium]|jgi:1A family penicillin-binding protein|nr:PBP1A family penicillin-binding protein [Candidatus Magasanikbacteria bacterium]MBT5262289.1 PBP1A family penicillin-binding protein [Candidatus Magasanikbacteria bacterium]MBT5820140.1 PBP1A family penicillin-binding protein [Candidatus Magasanikbacteria bacterium]MBT6294911.1 PBP1A family penicillin-binding protein [Candidatus Magasanikbacteria bacterium]